MGSLDKSMDGISVGANASYHNLTVLILKHLWRPHRHRSSAHSLLVNTSGIINTERYIFDSIPVFLQFSSEFLVIRP